MNYTFNNSSIVSVNSGTIVLNVSGKTRTFADAKLVSAVDGNIILDLPEVSFKKGDHLVIHTAWGNRTFILSKNTDIKVYYHVSTHSVGLGFNDFWFKAENTFRNATPEEIQELNEQLAAREKCWNPDTMQIEKLRWKPIKNVKYFHIIIAGGTIQVDDYRWVGDGIDKNLYDMGNCFETEEEAKAVAEKIKKLLLEV